MRDTGWQAQEWAHKRSAKCGEAFQFLMGRRPKAAEAPSALGLMAAWTGGCAGRAGVQTLLPGGAKSSHVQRKARSGREKKSHKEICLPPCKMAALKHLSGGYGGPGQRTHSCPGTVQFPEFRAWGKQPLEPPQPFACSPWPAP